MGGDTAVTCVTVEIGVYGGLVKWVRGIPKDLEVRVHDYDIDGVESGIISSDTDGNPCVVVTYKGQSDALHIIQEDT